MSISFSCNFCSRKYRVDDGLAGRQVKCKECGTDLTIPSGGAVSKPKSVSAPQQDLYGLDDDADADAPLPPPRRPGASTSSSPSSSGRRKRQSSSSSDENNGMRKAGQMFLTLGALSFVLPFIGLQIKGLHLLPPQAQAVGGIIMLAVGAFCLVASTGGVLAGLGIAGVGAVVLFLIASVFLNNGNNNNANAMANNGPPPNFNPPPQQPQNNFTPPPPANANPNPNPNPGPGPNANGPGIHITLSNGKAMPATGPLGNARGMGVDFHADYQMGQRPPGVTKYVTVITGPRTSASDMFSFLHGSGSIDRSSPTMSQNDGPFQMHIEAEVIGMGGMRRYKVSESIPLAWENAQPPQQPQFGPRGGNMPGQPGFRQPGMPGGPGNMPGQPGFRPPGMPPFGRRR